MKGDDRDKDQYCRDREENYRNTGYSRDDAREKAQRERQWERDVEQAREDDDHGRTDRR